MEQDVIFGAIYFVSLIVLLVAALICTLIFGSRRADRVEKYYQKLDEHDKAVINDWKEVNKLYSRDLRRKQNEDK